jgi:hypothetical protein
VTGGVTGRFTFHLPGSVLRDPALMKPYYRRLISGLRNRGIGVELVVHDRATTLATVEAIPGFHIADHGSLRHRRVLNTGIAYVYPFWNLDPWGIRAESSIAAKPFVPGAEGPARAFADRLRKRLVGARKSRYPQPVGRTAVPEGCIAVFLQSEAHRGVGEKCHLTMRQMLAAVLDRDDPRPVIVKPHPRDPDPETRRFLAGLAAGEARLRVLDANIHDILSQAAVAVTINSAVGIEAHLHHVPVVLCGVSDFHHAAVTLRQAAGMAAALAEAEATRWPHDAFLSWYFEGQCLNAGKDSLVADFLVKAAAAGFDPVGVAR